LEGEGEEIIDLKKALEKIDFYGKNDANNFSDDEEVIPLKGEVEYKEQENNFYRIFEETAEAILRSVE
jgi:hypothetical protein